jgi:hypothetical protein
MRYARRADQDVDTSLRERKKIRSQFRLEMAVKDWITRLRRIAVQCLRGVSHIQQKRESD